ncbi:50S ribosomal protein L4 [Candidatus Uhrbacteria bacterium]|nr:50S ribosomal protein L4 [Candidatus Uhrbacteria bacterium]
MKRKEKKFGDPLSLDVYSMQGTVVSSRQLPPEIFSVPIKEELVHFVVTAQDANARKGTATTKGKGEVRGGGKKPWKQKGTGRARHGSIRSPLWRGGGITFGPRGNQNWSVKINKKVKRKALCMVLSDRAAGHALILLDGLQFENPKTKEAHAFLGRLPLAPAGKRMPRTGIVIPSKQIALRRSMRNIPRVEVLSPASLNVRDTLKCSKIIMSLSSLDEIIALLGEKKE